MDSPPPGARALALALAIVTLVSACTMFDAGTPGDTGAPPGGSIGGGSAAPGNGRVDPGLLRVRADLAAGLSEHVLLLAGAADARLAGQEEEYQAAVGLLTGDSAVSLAELVGSVGDPRHGESFREWWVLANDALLAAVDAGAAGEPDPEDPAAELARVAGGLAQPLQEATGLPAEEAEVLLREHFERLQRMVAAQAADDGGDAYALVREASLGADGLARPLAAAAGGEDPRVLPPSGLSVRLNLLLQEHVHLLTLGTSAALSGDTDRFNAIAATVVEGTAVDLANTVGSARDRAAGENFLAAWNEHIRWVVAYTEATAVEDGQAVLDALDGLTESLVTVAATLEEITGLPAQTSAAAFAGYLTSISQIVDAQGAGGTGAQAEGDPSATVTGATLEAGRELRALAEPLAEAITRTREGAGS